jgi:dTDP-4-amino-4,6-dideoxygalactose transaminase
MSPPSADPPERIHLSSPDVGPLERDALLRAFDSGWIAPVGPELDGFEDELSALTGWPGAVALSSGTAALHLALQVAGVANGDEVYVSTFTFAASANAVTYLGARPRFIDSDSATWNMSPPLLAEQLTVARRTGKLPAAVVVVDLYGQCADYDEIIPLCQELGVPVVEDAAEAIGATYKGRPAGTLAEAGVFSFNGNKIMTTSGGGAFVSADRVVADRVRHLATQAREPFVHYEHHDIGFNYRMSNLLAAIGRAQLSRLPEMTTRRRTISDRYRTRLGDIEGLHFMPIAPWDGWNGWLTCVTFDEAETRDRVRSALDEQDIDCRPLWKPMHLQPVFAGSPATVDGTSERLFGHGVCLPSGSVLADDQIDRVIDTIMQALRA